MVQTRHFRNWIVTPQSARLLVHGDFDNSSRNSPFSILAATISHGFKISPKLISLIFFCDQHLLSEEYHGGDTMICSLIEQLQRQYLYVTISPGPNTSMRKLDSANVRQLCSLFVYLVRQLPPHMTVFCLIDGINEYEREEYIHGMDDVVYALLKLVDERQ
jgi:hypothetical protein